MKLLLCMKCQDVIRLQEGTERACKCGKVKGMYTDDINAVYEGGNDAVLIGFVNSELVNAARYVNHNADKGKRFDAFVIPKNTCRSFRPRK